MPDTKGQKRRHLAPHSRGSPSLPPTDANPGAASLLRSNGVCATRAAGTYADRKLRAFPFGNEAAIDLATCPSRAGFPSLPLRRPARLRTSEKLFYVLQTKHNFRKGVALPQGCLFLNR